MMLQRFGINGSLDFDANTARIFTQRALHIGEAITTELNYNSMIMAPFERIEISIYDERFMDLHKNRIINFGDYVDIRIGLGQEIAFTEYSIFRETIFRLTQKALLDLEQAFNWDARQVMDILQSISQRAIIFSYHSKSLSKLDETTGYKADVYFTMDDKKSEIRLKVVSKENDVIKQEVVASREPPGILESFFPVTASVLRDNQITFYSEDKTVLKVVSLTA